MTEQTEPQFRTCEELEMDGLEPHCMLSSCVYANQCQRRYDPDDPNGLA